MKNETAKLDCVRKIITFKFNDEVFITDIKEGDLGDSWNTITDKNGVMWDVNFYWEDVKGCKPSFCVYGLTEKDGVFSINMNDETNIKIGRSNANVFFKEERMEIKKKKK